MPVEIKEDLIPIPIPIARKGINKDIDPACMEGEYSPYMLNMIIEAARIRKRLGYSMLGSNLPLRGIGSKLINYVDARGTSHTIAITTTHAYVYQPDLDNWLQITPSVYLENCTEGWAAGSGDTVEHVTECIRSSKSVKITLIDSRSDGNQLAYKDIESTDISAMTHIGFWIKSSVALAADALEVVISESNHASGEKTGTYVECLSTALAADTWTFVCLAKTLTSFNAVISCSIYANTSLASGTIIYLDDIRGYDELSGSADIAVAESLATDISYFALNGGLAQLISNGVDDIFYFEGTTDNLLETLEHGYSSFANCFSLAEFWNHLMLINFNNEDQNVRSVAWADLGNVDEFVEGTSGLAYLTDSKGEIIKAAKLGSNIILYSTKSITVGRYYGGTVIFLFPTLIYSTGLLVPNAIVELPDRHQIIGSDQKLYDYAGSTQLDRIGMAIEKSFFTEMNSTNVKHVVCGYDEANDRSYFAFPRASDTYAKAAYCMNLRSPDHPWEYFEFAHDIRSIAMHESKVALYCDSEALSGLYCDKAVFYCDTSFGEMNYPMMISLSSDGYVFVHDELLGTDAGEGIDCRYDTQDITLLVDLVSGWAQSRKPIKEVYFARWEWFAFTAMSSIAGASVSVFYSIDGGVTWIELDDSPVTLTSNWTMFRLPLDVVSRKIRFRFEQLNSGDLQIRDDMFVECVPETTRD